MPRFQDETMESHAIGGTTFQFSGKKINELGATEYTLATVVIDRSGSVTGYDGQINKAVQEVVRACRKSPRADNLMLRVVIFDSSVDEFHGFKPLPDCNEADYAHVCVPRGSTMLFDAIHNAIAATVQYGKTLVDSDFSVNAAVFVITDGGDTGSTATPKMVKDALENALRSESLESIMPVLIGVGYEADETGANGLSAYLKKVQSEAGFQQYVFCDRASDAKLAKLGAFISKSISSQSQSLGSGGVSQSLVF